jgi:cyanamide hydratase
MATADPHVNGWTTVPRSIDSFLSGANASNTKPFAVSDIEIPTSKAAQQTQAYAKEFLSEPTFNHSMRVFYYGMDLINA